MALCLIFDKFIKRILDDMIFAGFFLRKEPKPECVHSGVRTAESTTKPNRTVLGRPAREGESPVRERQGREAGSRVPRDTRNLVGMSGDHPVRLNTP